MAPEQSELARNIGFFEAMSLGAGAMIGAGIFILPGVAAANAGPASSLAFAIAGVVALLAAISLSELATGMPVAGGSYHYVNRALGGFLGSIVGWGMWTGLMFASAFYMIGFGQYIVGGIDFLEGRYLVVLFGLIGLAFLVGVNYMGTEESGKFQNWTIGILTLIILAFLGFGYFYVDLDNLQPFAPMGARGIMATTGIVFVTFLGFEIIATVAEEIKNPGKIIPLTMILSVVLVVISQMDLTVILIGIGIILLACAWYYFYSSKHITDDNLVGNAIVRSFIETKTVDDDGEELYRVAVSIANPKTQADLLRMAAASAQYHRGKAKPQVLALNIIKVPMQTSLEQNLQFEYEQIEQQRELLEVGREICSELGVELKTRVIIGRSIFKSILAYIEQKGADQLVIGWNPQKYHRNYIFGSNLDPIIKEAPCDVTLVNFKREDRGSVVALTGPGPHTPKAIQRAYEYALLDNLKPTLLNVQRPAQMQNGEMSDPEEVGREMIVSLADKAGIPADGYDAKVLVNNNIEQSINKAVESFNTVFLGISEQSTFAKILYGSVAARIANKDNINVVMIRGKHEKNWTLRAALAKRLSE